MASRKSLQVTEFGNPVLRQKAAELTIGETKLAETAHLIEEMRELLLTKKLGVGLAAPQVGESKAIFVIAIRASQHRPEVKEYDLVAINPKIIQTFGRKTQRYEGCISGGPHKAGLFAKVPRYKKLKLSYFDEKGKSHTKTFDGLAAHVIQHEVDHLNGILFVDRVKDSKSYMTYKEYVKLARRQPKDK